jgi:hypothetical protein
MHAGLICRFDMQIDNKLIYNFNVKSLTDVLIKFVALATHHLT